MLDTHGHKHLTMLGYVVGPNLLLFYMMAYRWFASLQESRLKTFPRILDLKKRNYGNPWIYINFIDSKINNYKNYKLQILDVMSRTLHNVIEF